MQRIPEKYRKENMTLGATFISDSNGLQVTLERTKSVRDPDSKIDERIGDSGCNIKFKGGHCLITNQNLFKLMVGSTEYKKGVFRLDDEDPTGFWRAAGVLEVATVKIPVLDNITEVDVSKIDFKKMKAPVEGGKTLPLRKLAHG